MSDKKNCVMSGMLCCYSGCDFENILICCVGQSDCLCLRHACCIAANVENRGIGMTTNKDAGEICKIGCFCCDYGCVYPKVCCAGVSQCLCCYSVASCFCFDYFLKEAVCAMYCLQCIPEFGCCMPPQDCPALTDLRTGSYKPPAKIGRASCRERV